MSLFRTQKMLHVHFPTFLLSYFLNNFTPFYLDYSIILCIFAVNNNKNVNRCPR